MNLKPAMYVLHLLLFGNAAKSTVLLSGKAVPRFSVAALACLLVTLLGMPFQVQGADEIVDRSEAAINRLRAQLVEHGCSRELSNQILALTRMDDLRTDEISLIVHYAVFCPGPYMGEFFLNGLVANRDFKKVDSMQSRRLVVQAYYYFGNRNMYLALADLEGRITSLEDSQVEKLSDIEIRREIDRFKEAPEPALRARLRRYATYLLGDRRAQITSEIINALLESDPDNPDLLTGKGMLALTFGDNVFGKETLAKAWQSKHLPALLPYATSLAKLKDMESANSLVGDLITYKRWEDDIPKVLMAIAIVMLDEPEHYRATIDKILLNVTASDLKDDESKQMRKGFEQRWKVMREE